MCSGEAWRRSTPSNQISPSTMAVGNRRRIDSAVTVLPEPDSPTMPTRSWRPTDSRTPLTARTVPWRVGKLIARFFTSSSGAAVVFRPALWRRVVEDYGHDGLSWGRPEAPTGGSATTPESMI